MNYGAIGFTGTQSGMNQFQKMAVLAYLNLIDPVEVHHGSCIGADAEFHAMTVDKYETHVHPCTLLTKQAPHPGATFVYVAKEPLERNRDIVNESLLVIATPRGKERPRSGTWMTVNYARKLGRPLLIVYPKYMEFENWPESLRRIE